MKEAFVEILEEPTMKEDFEDTPEEDPINLYTKSCYSCGEEGHIDQYCPKEYLVEFPTVEVDYGPQEIEVPIGMEKSRKRNRMYPKKNPISTKKDLSHITCYRCNDLCHYAYKC